MVTRNTGDTRGTIKTAFFFAISKGGNTPQPSPPLPPPVPSVPKPHQNPWHTARSIIHPLPKYPPPPEPSQPLLPSTQTLPETQPKPQTLHTWHTASSIIRSSLPAAAWPALSQITPPEKTFCTRGSCMAAAASTLGVSKQKWAFRSIRWMDGRKGRHGAAAVGVKQCQD